MFIKVKESKGSQQLVNIIQIEKIEDNNEFCTIEFSNKLMIVVESFEELQKKIHNAINF